MIVCSKKMKNNIERILKFDRTEETKLIIREIMGKYEELPDSENQRMKELTGNDGRIDLDIIPNIILPSGIAATAWYTEGWYLLPNDNPCLMKKMLSFMGQYGKVENAHYQPEEYNAMICQALAEIFELPSAKYYMAKKNGNEYMLTPDFLRDGEELIHIARIEETITGKKQSTTAIQGETKKISQMHQYLEEYLRNYQYKGKKLEETQIQIVLLDYIKQKFFNRFVKNTDEHVFNTAIVINGEKVKMSDMYDYDFTLARKTTDVVPGCEWKGLENEMLLDNGKSDIVSFIEQYKDYPGFQEFIRKIINNFSIARLEQIILRNTGIKIDRVETKKHYEIIEENFKETVNAYNRFYIKQRKGEER